MMVVCIYTHPNTAKVHAGMEYTNATPVKETEDINELHSRIEAMHATAMAQTKQADLKKASALGDHCQMGKGKP